MPVEIKELVIRAVYEKQGKQHTINGINNGQLMSRREKLSIIETCVEQVLEILEKRQRR